MTLNFNLILIYGSMYITLYCIIFLITNKNEWKLLLNDKKGEKKKKMENYTKNNSIYPYQKLSKKIMKIIKGKD